MVNVISSILILAVYTNLLDNFCYVFAGKIAIYGLGFIINVSFHLRFSNISDQIKISFKLGAIYSLILVFESVTLFLYILGSVNDVVFLSLMGTDLLMCMALVKYSTEEFFKFFHPPFFILAHSISYLIMAIQYIKYDGFLGWFWSMSYFYIKGLVQFTLGVFLVIFSFCYLWMILKSPNQQQNTKFTVFILFSIFYLIFVNIVYIFQVDGWRRAFDKGLLKTGIEIQEIDTHLLQIISAIVVGWGTISLIFLSLIYFSLKDYLISMLFKN